MHVPARPSAPVSIQGNVIERVSSYKYLSVNLNNKLGRSAHTGALYKKGQSGWLLPRRLRSHYQRCPPTPVRTFSDSMLASAIFHGVVCCAGSTSGRKRQEIVGWAFAWQLLQWQNAPPSLQERGTSAPFDAPKLNNTYISYSPGHYYTSYNSGYSIKTSITVIVLV